jgi:hypothetical protein
MVFDRNFSANIKLSVSRHHKNTPWPDILIVQGQAMQRYVPQQIMHQWEIPG